MGYGVIPIHEVKQSLQDLHKVLTDNAAEVDVLLSSVPSVLSSGVSAEDKYARLNCIVDDLYAILKPHIACADGCSHCCNMAVPIGCAEATAIAKAYDMRLAYPPPMTDKDTNIHKYRLVPCVFLMVGKCSVYEHRPAACRSYFNVSKFSALCDMVNNPESDVPALDLSELTYAYAQVEFERYGTLYYADIREWFSS